MNHGDVFDPMNFYVTTSTQLIHPKQKSILMTQKRTFSDSILTKEEEEKRLTNLS